MFNKEEKGMLIKALETTIGYKKDAGVSDRGLVEDRKLLKKVQNMETFDDVVEKLNKAEVRISEE